MEENGLYYIQLCQEKGSPNEDVSNTAFAVETINSIELAHARFGHRGEKYLRKLWELGVKTGITQADPKEKLPECRVCRICKFNRPQHPRRKSDKDVERGEVICSDIWGKFRIKSTDNNVYSVHFTDLYSRYSQVYFLKERSSKALLEAFKKYCLL